MQKNNFSVTKLVILIVSVVLIFGVAVTFSFIFLKAKRESDIHNVFDRLYYEVRAVKRGSDSVLVSGTETAYADYDFGAFENIQIPDLDMCISINSTNSDKIIYFLFFNHGPNGEWDTSHCILFKYNVEEKTLYGAQSFEYFVANFLSDYFKWSSDAGENNPYTLDDLGEYSFEYQEDVSY